MNRSVNNTNEPIEELQSSVGQLTINDEEAGSKVLPQANSYKCENCLKNAVSIGIQSNDSGIQRTQLLCVKCASDRYQEKNLKDQKGVGYTCYGCNSSFESFHKARKKTGHKNCLLKKTTEASNPVPHPPCQGVGFGFGWPNLFEIQSHIHHDYLQQIIGIQNLTLSPLSNPEHVVGQHDSLSSQSSSSEPTNGQDFEAGHGYQRGKRARAPWSTASSNLSSNPSSSRQLRKARRKDFGSDIDKLSVIDDCLAQVCHEGHLTPEEYSSFYKQDGQEQLRMFVMCVRLMAQVTLPERQSVIEQIKLRMSVYVSK